MLTPNERLVQEAIDLVRESKSPNLVFASVFMSFEAISAVVNAVGSDLNSVTRSLTFSCLYFGT